MTGNSRLLARIALFSALIYVLSLGSAAIPNIKPLFFIVFSAGYLWGAFPGSLVGAIGMGLWTFFNPYGPAPIPVAFAQIFGAMLCGLTGAFFSRFIQLDNLQVRDYVLLVVAGIICTLLFFIPVSIVDAWLYQPFRVRFISSMIFSGWAILSNAVIFPLLFRLLRPFYVREKNR